MQTISSLAILSKAEFTIDIFAKSRTKKKKMQLQKIIKIAAKRTGDQKNLAKVIGVTPDVLTHAKSGRRGLPAIACGKLAVILEIDRWTVIAASELVTEKSEEKRAYFSPFVLNGVATLVTAISVLALSNAPIETSAPDDTFNKSCIAPQPAPLSSSMVGAIYIMSNWLRKLASRTGASVRNKLGAVAGYFGWPGSLSSE